MAEFPYTTLVVGLRESLEAFLIVGILAGLVRKLHHGEGRRYILWGSLAAVAVSLLLGLLVSQTLVPFYNGPWFETIASFLAVGVLSYMAVWMYKHTRGLVGTLHQRTKAALAAQRPWVLASLAFVAILREGVETVLITAGDVARNGAPMTLLAVAIGIALSALIAFLVFSGVMRMSIERFMAVTGFILIVMAAGMLAYGVHEFTETRSALGDAVKATGTAYDWSAVLPHDGAFGDRDIDTVPEYVGLFLSAAIGYRDSASWAEVGAWAVYLAVMTAWLLRAGRHDHIEGRPPAAAATSSGKSATTLAAPGSPPPRPPEEPET